MILRFAFTATRLAIAVVLATSVLMGWSSCPATASEPSVHLIGPVQRLADGAGIQITARVPCSNGQPKTGGSFGYFYQTVSARLVQEGLVELRFDACSQGFSTTTAITASPDITSPCCRPAVIYHPWSLNQVAIISSSIDSDSDQLTAIRNVVPGSPKPPVNAPVIRRTGHGRLLDVTFAGTCDPQSPLVQPTLAVAQVEANGRAQNQSASSFRCDPEQHRLHATVASGDGALRTLHDALVTSTCDSPCPPALLVSGVVPVTDSQKGRS